MRFQVIKLSKDLIEKKSPKNRHFQHDFYQKIAKMTAYICKSKPRSAKFRQNPFTLKCIFSAARPIRTKINILRTKHSVSTFLAGLIRNKPCISIRFRRRVNCILYLHVYDQIFKIRFTPSLKLRGGGGEAPLFAESIEKRTVKCNALTGQLLASQNGF